MSLSGSKRAERARSRWMRWAVLVTVLVAVTGIALGHQYINGPGKPTTIDALCPFGGIESLYSVLTGAGYIDKVRISSFVLLFGTIGLALVMRRSFCGQICPLGTLQELSGIVGRRLFRRRRPQIPAVIDKPARLLKYLVLIGFGIWTWQAAALVMRPYDPWAAWAHLTSADLFTELGVGAIVLGVSLVGSAVYERFFCKYLCPMGAFLGVFSKLSVLNIARDAETCTSCSLCDKACPMNVPVSTADTVTASECISCNECVNACPVSETLTVKAPTARLTTLATTSLVVVAFAALVGVTTFTGTFDWTMPSLAEAIQVQPNNGGTFDTAAIKGYMSMAEIAAAADIPESAFIERWSVPQEALGEPMKDIKDIYGFSPDDVRAWVTEMLAAR